MWQPTKNGTEKYMHMGRGQETNAMGNSHGQSKFPKK